MKYSNVRFLAALLIFCLVVLIAPYAAIKSNTLYCKHTKIFWNPIDCYKFSLHDQTSDIVFVGDSSLVFGVRPNLIESRLHLSAYNLGQPAGAMIFSPGLLLDHYLAKNRRPRLIVLYVGPWTLLKHQPDIAHLWDDGARAALRHGTFAQVFDIFANDPRRLLRVPIIFLQQGWRRYGVSEAWWRDASTEMREGRGWFAVWRANRPFSIERPGGPHPVPIELPDRCSLGVKPIGSPDRAQIEAFRDKYQQDGTRVVVYIAPVPNCDRTYPDIVSAYAGISDNRPQTLPGRNFIDDGWRVHLTASGARQATGEVADFIASLIGPRPDATYPPT